MRLTKFLGNSLIKGSKPNAHEAFEKFKVHCLGLSLHHFPLHGSEFMKFPGSLAWQFPELFSRFKNQNLPKGEVASWLQRFSNENQEKYLAQMAFVIFCEGHASTADDFEKWLNDSVSVCGQSEVYLNGVLIKFLEYMASDLHASGASLFKFERVLQLCIRWQDRLSSEEFKLGIGYILPLMLYSANAERDCVHIYVALKRALDLGCALDKSLLASSITALINQRFINEALEFIPMCDFSFGRICQLNWLMLSAVCTTSPPSSIDPSSIIAKDKMSIFEGLEKMYLANKGEERFVWDYWLQMLHLGLRSGNHALIGCSMDQLKGIPTENSSKEVAMSWNLEHVAVWEKMAGSLKSLGRVLPFLTHRLRQGTRPREIPLNENIKAYIDLVCIEYNFRENYSIAHIRPFLELIVERNLVDGVLSPVLISRITLALFHKKALNVPIAFIERYYKTLSDMDFKQGCLNFRAYSCMLYHWKRILGKANAGVVLEKLLEKNDTTYDFGFGISHALDASCLDLSALSSSQTCRDHLQKLVF